MHEFDEKIQKCNNVERIVSEVIQLENYVFKKDIPTEASKMELAERADEVLNDLE